MEEVEKEIISIGGYSNVIILPREWVKQNKWLEVGTKVKLKNMGNSIVIEILGNKHKIDWYKILEEVKKNPPNIDDVADPL